MIYLDNAATSFPKPEAVVRSVRRCMESYCGNPGRGSNRMALRAAEKIYECRCLAAELFSACAPENVVLTMNATHALNIAIKGLVPPGSRVIISDMEHNSVLRPVESLRARRGVNYDIFTSGNDKKMIAAEIESLITPDTSAVICTHSSNIVNRTLPAAEIGEVCRRAGILFILDASQSAGIQNINMKKLGVSALCMPGHKGLLGPQGTGLLILADGVLPDTLTEGGSGVNSAEYTMPPFLPDRLEAGTMPTPGAAGLCEGIRYVMSRTSDDILSCESSLAASLRESLLNNPSFEVYGENEPGGIVLFNIKGTCSQKTAALLDGEEICVRAGLHCAPLAHRAVGTPDGGAVRVSVGAFSRARDISALQRALFRICGEL